MLTAVLTIGIKQLHKELVAVNPAIKLYALREMCEDGRLPAFRNPMKGEGWWMVDLNRLGPPLKPYFTEEEWVQVKQALHLDVVEQRRLSL